MPNCVTCGKHYNNSPYNNTSQCDDCFCSDSFEIDDELLIDLNNIRNPSGRTRAIIQDFNDDEDSFGF
jgi:hypothetical protein